MTLGIISDWHGVEGVITSDSGEQLPVDVSRMPFTRCLVPARGTRVYFDVEREEPDAPYARNVWAILTGAKPPVVDQFSKFRKEAEL